VKHRYDNIFYQEISDTLTTCLANKLSQPFPSDLTTEALRRSYVTYTAPISLSAVPESITILESPSLLAATGTTGLRTWEAAKYLTAFLYSSEGRRYVSGHSVIELGAGTGLVSMFCAKYLGAPFVLATDGTGEVVDALAENLYLNELDGRIGGFNPKIQAIVLRWGHAITRELIQDEDETKNYELIVGADIVGTLLIHSLF
jgi:protein-lysine N-methyltransferase EEF2KMT